MKFSPAVALCALLLLSGAACSGSKNAASGTGPSPTATNPVDFPMFDGAQILSARAWHETVRSRPGTADNAVFTQGSGTYDGHDVVAGTQALMPVLETWLHDLQEKPPDGYTVAIGGDQVEAVRTHTRDLGIDFAVFEGPPVNGKRHGVAVLAVDPQTLDQKAGPMLGMVGKFKLLPKTLRDPIDAQARKQTGISVSEATNPDTPIGAAIGALDQLRDFGGRGIVIIDAVKE
jgi:hypothetical protein